VPLTGLACCRGRTGWCVGGCTVEQCSITTPVRAGHRLGVLPAGVFAWRGELVPCVLPRGSSSVWAAPRSCGAQDSPLQPLCVGPVLVEDENYSCERVVEGGDSLCEAETC
jgi:hypothetical protein